MEFFQETVSSPLFSRALAPPFPSTNVEEILSGDQKIWSGKLAAQKLTRDNDLRLYYGRLYEGFYASN